MSTTLPNLSNVKLWALLMSLMERHTPYVLGGKIVPITKQAFDLLYDRGVDCSGFVTWAIWHACGKTWPDGSVNIHEHVKLSGYEEVELDAPDSASPTAVFIFFLPPIDEEPGHTGFVNQGKTLESYGHADGHNNGLGGPGSRKWDGKTWQSNCCLYRLV